MDGLGNINWWGFSPAIDFLEILSNENNVSDESEELNILVVCAGDPRHILKTIANRTKWPLKKKLIRFYVYDSRLELYARNLLLLSLALENPSKHGIQEKTELFMEIFANLRVRDQTAQYIRTIASDFIKCITDFEQLKKINLSCFDFSLLKFKERDFLEGIFKYWRLDYLNKTVFPAETCWDLRLRTYFKTRFDSRKNAFDWDFQMKLTERQNASIIHNRIYSYWRDTGNAYELRDANYNCPNLTLASTTVFDNPNSLDKAIRRGYFGDIVISPYLCYGIESENKDFFKKANDQFRHTSVDVAQANITSFMESILIQKGYKIEKSVNDSNLNKNLSELKIEEVNEEDEDAVVVDIKTNDKIESDKPIDNNYLDFSQDVQLIYLPLTAFDNELINKAKFENYFHMAYFSNYGFKFFNKNLIQKVMKKNNHSNVIVFETAKYMIELSNDKINQFSRHLIQSASDNKFKCFKNENYDLQEQFQYKKTNETSKDANKDDDNDDDDDKLVKEPVEKHDYFKFIYVNKNN